MADLLFLLSAKIDPGTYVSALEEFLPMSPCTHGGCSGLPHLLPELETLMFTGFCLPGHHESYPISANSFLMYTGHKAYIQFLMTF